MEPTHRPKKGCRYDYAYPEGGKDPEEALPKKASDVVSHRTTSDEESAEAEEAVYGHRACSGFAVDILAPKASHRDRVREHHSNCQREAKEIEAVPSSLKRSTDRSANGGAAGTQVAVTHPRQTPRGHIGVTLKVPCFRCLMSTMSGIALGSSEKSDPLVTGVIGSDFRKCADACQGRMEPLHCRVVAA